MRFQIEPPACNLNELGLVMPDSFDDWLIESIGPGEIITLRNLVTNHLAELGKDHVYDYRSNPSRSKEGIKHGFLMLKVQIFTQGPKLWLRPNAKPGERVAHSDRQHHAAQWTPRQKIDVSSYFPPTASFIKLQYRLWSELHSTPLLIRISSYPEDAAMLEYSGPSGLIEIMLTDGPEIYVSFSHPTVNYQLTAIGWTNNL